MQIDFSNLSQYSVIAYCQILLQRLRPLLPFRGSVGEKYYDVLTSALAAAACKTELSGDDICAIKAVADGAATSTFPSTFLGSDYAGKEISAIHFGHETALIVQIIAALYKEGVFSNQNYYSSSSDSTVITALLTFITQKTLIVVHDLATYRKQPPPNMEHECATTCKSLASISPLNSDAPVDVSKLEAWNFEVPDWINNPYGF